MAAKDSSELPQEVSESSCFVPDGVGLSCALGRTTHLGVGAHQDDLEFMAMAGILSCYQQKDAWFGGIICTDGAGSARAGEFAHFTDEAMKKVRGEEQRKAAVVGEYTFVAQLEHPSALLKDRNLRSRIVKELRAYITATKPEIIYTHNPFDKHPSHLGVLKALLEALLSLPSKDRPQKLIGCEVWRSLDWLPEHLKLIQNVSAHGGLSEQLNACFASQIAGGKRYDLAVEGRRLANATFHEAHQIDAASKAAFAVDLSALIDSKAIPLDAYVERVLADFQSEIRVALGKL